MRGLEGARSRQRQSGFQGDPAPGQVEGCRAQYSTRAHNLSTLVDAGFDVDTAADELRTALEQEELESIVERLLTLSKKRAAPADSGTDSEAKRANTGDPSVGSFTRVYNAEN